MKLKAHPVEKPWGRTDLDPVFGAPSSQRIGEIWFQDPKLHDLPLLVKYIFTGDKLSVQVHPNDNDAHDRGFDRGKNECWYILRAEEGSKLGLGLKAPVSKDELRSAAIDGSIEQLMDWRTANAGDFFYVPAGTIHAIGAGITLLEIQQNSDITYRLYDYGRPRELHLDDAIAVSLRGPYAEQRVCNSRTATGDVLIDEAPFSVIRASSLEGIPASLTWRQRWIMPLRGTAVSKTENASAGECLLLEPGEDLVLSPNTLVLIGVAGRI
jgi:mannose-6-phosphate isomerase